MHYYTFEIGDERVGYFEYEDRDGVLYQNARMEIEGKVMENPFWVKHEGGQILAYKCHDQDYIDIPIDSGLVPSSALMLLLLGGEIEMDQKFTMINEGSGELEEGRFKQVEDRFQLIVNGAEENYYVLKDGEIKEFGWGGPTRSRKMNSKASAIKGTYWEE